MCPDRRSVSFRSGCHRTIPARHGAQRYTGVAPVTKRSGGSERIHRRYCRSKFHRQSFHEYAKESVLWSQWAGAYYLQQRSKGRALMSATGSGEERNGERARE
jgi:hypothetical protein